MTTAWRCGEVEKCRGAGERGFKAFGAEAVVDAFQGSDDEEVL